MKKLFFKFPWCIWFHCYGVHEAKLSFGKSLVMRMRSFINLCLVIVWLCVNEFKLMHTKRTVLNTVLSSFLVVLKYVVRVKILPLVSFGILFAAKNDKILNRQWAFSIYQTILEISVGMWMEHVPLEIFWNKWNSWKGSPVFPVETSQWKFVFHLQNSRLYHQFNAVRCLLSSQAFLGSLEWNLWQMERVLPKTEIPDGNFPQLFVNGKCPISLEYWSSVLENYTLRAVVIATSLVPVCFCQKPRISICNLWRETVIIFLTPMIRLGGVDGSWW